MRWVDSFFVYAALAGVLNATSPAVAQDCNDPLFKGLMIETCDVTPNPRRPSGLPPPSRFPCQVEQVTGWLDRHGAYGDRPFDDSLYDNEVNWIVNGKISRKTRSEIAKEENDFRRVYPIQKYVPRTSSVVMLGGQCVITQQVDSYKRRANGREEHSAFKIEFVIRTDVNGPLVVGQRIQVLASP